MFLTNRIILGAALLVSAKQSRSQSPAPPGIAERQMENAKKMEAAAAVQKKSAQTQTAVLPEGSFFSAGWSGPAMLTPDVPDCPAMKDSESAPLIGVAAEKHRLNPELIKAVIRQESGFRPCAISEKGAIGLMQLMPETLQALKTLDPLDPAQNIEAGATYLKQMLERFKGNLRLALAAYNAGPERVDGVKPAVPDIPETLAYVEAVSIALHGAPAETAATWAH